MKNTPHEEAQLIIDYKLHLLQKKDPEAAKELREHFVEVNQITEAIKTKLISK